jgi:hypothetical protein
MRKAPVEILESAFDGKVPEDFTHLELPKLHTILIALRGSGEKNKNSTTKLVSDRTKEFEAIEVTDEVDGDGNALGDMNGGMLCLSCFEMF